MSANDQADGFYESPYYCIRCGPNNPCMCVLKPNENSGRGRKFEKAHDVARQMQYPVGMRLARGFAILGGGKHDL